MPKKIASFIQELERFSASAKEKAKWHRKIQFKDHCKSNIGAISDFIQEYPHLDFQDAFNACCEYATTSTFSKGLHKDCLDFVKNLDMGCYSVKHPLYKKSSIIKRIQMHSIGRLEEPLSEATLAKMKNSNADLKAMKDDLQIGHVRKIKAYKFAFLCVLSPLLNNLGYYLEKNMIEIRLTEEAITTRSPMEQMAWNCALQKKQFIRDNLLSLQLDIEEVCLDLKK